MKKRCFRLAVTMVLAAVMACSFSLTAFAGSDYFKVTLKKGDTVYSLCRENGLDYSKEKNVIMVLNDMDRESQLSALRAGDTIKLPAQKCAPASKNVISSEDAVEYYVIPYVIEKGDTIAHVYWLWGLRFEKYAEEIKALNGVDDLDLLYVGAIYLLPTTESNLKTDTYTTVMSHIMRQGETAYDVFAGYGIDYNSKVSTLERYNGGADLTKLSVGDKLLIPLL